MASFHKLPSTRSYLAFQEVDDSIFHGSTILLPDPTLMKRLSHTLSPAAYQQLREFYAGLQADAGEVDIFPCKGILLFTSSILQNMFNYFENGLDVYHNGVRVRPKEEVALHSRDIIRIGDSIVFSYIEKK